MSSGPVLGNSIKLLGFPEKLYEPPRRPSGPGAGLTLNNFPGGFLLGPTS